MAGRLKGIGPGVIVAAAFIGPGTVTTASLAGTSYGVSLLWALLFATIATVILQEMSARLGLVTGRGLASALRGVRGPAWLGPTLAWLGVAAVVGGAAAYEAGNLVGAGLGLESLAGLSFKTWAGLGTAGAGILLWTGRYRLIERALTICVALMGTVFVATALVAMPAMSEILKGSLVPRIPSHEARITALGLIGTTIVPYNLFLHASAVRERWTGAEDLPAARLDLVLAIMIGGIVSGAIVITASALPAGATIKNAGDMAGQLEPLLGAWAGKAFAAGFSAAAISSAITAPLAAAYAMLDVLGKNRDTGSSLSRTVWGGTLLTGLGVAMAGIKPVPLILAAQVLNGLVLPLVAVVLLIAMNDRRLLGSHVNGWRANLSGGTVTLLAGLLGTMAIIRAFG